MIKRSLVLLIVLFSTTLFSQEMKLDALVDKALITTNDSFIFKVRLESPKELKPQLPELGDTFKGLRVLDFGTDNDESDSKINVTSRWYKLQADISGSYILPSIKISYKDKDNVDKTLQTSEIFIEVEASSKGKKGEDPQTTTDIKGLKDLEYSPKDYRIWMLIGGITFLIVLVLAYIRRKTNGVKIEEKYVSPFEKASLGLANLRKIELSSEGGQKEYYFKISEIIRLYVEEEFEFPASDRTNEEIRKGLHKLKVIDSKNKSIFLDILTRADLVKFANIAPSIDEGENILAQAEGFIKEVCPKKDPEETKEEESFV